MSWAHAAPGVQPNAVAKTSGYRQAEAAAAKVNPQQQSAYDLLRHQLQSWGLGMLYHQALGFLKQGIAQNPQSLQLELQNTKEWKQRFAGNELRKQNGLPELSPAQYLQMESSYQGILQAYGLPKGFYDQHSDFAKLIGGNVSVSEMETRAKIAHDQYMNAPLQMKQMWAQYFGSKGDAIAGILNPKLATQLIQDRANMVAIGGNAAEQGLSVGKQRARQLEQAGVTPDQAKQGYSQIAQALPNDQSIGERFGTTFTQRDEENDILLNQADAARKRQRIYGQEVALFNERASNDANSLGVSQSY